MPTQMVFILVSPWPFQGCTKPSKPTRDGPIPIPHLWYLREYWNPHNRQGTTPSCAWHLIWHIILPATHIHTYIHTCMHACMHASIHTYIHTYICIYIYIYTSQQTRDFPGPSSKVDGALLHRGAHAQRVDLRSFDLRRGHGLRRLAERGLAWSARSWGTDQWIWPWYIDDGLSDLIWLVVWLPFFICHFLFSHILGF